MTAARHSSEQFVVFLGDVVAGQPQGCEIRAICNNVRSHQTELVRVFLSKRTNVQIHCTPTYSSGLNQVENWFARIQRDVISRSIFTAVTDLDPKPMRCIRECNKDPKPIQWKYGNPQRRYRQFQ
ncbi:MAG: transposase [Comamonadaceae bacterium]|jgi:transposase|nr:transposase [Comamonadaceae bacterium]